MKVCGWKQGQTSQIDQEAEDLDVSNDKSEKQAKDDSLAYAQHLPLKNAESCNSERVERHRNKNSFAAVPA